MPEKRIYRVATEFMYIASLTRSFSARVESRLKIDTIKCRVLQVESLNCVEISSVLN